MNTQNLMTLNILNQDNWKINAFYRILDAIIISIKTRFPSENLNISTFVDGFTIHRIL